MLQFPTAARRNWTGAFPSIVFGTIVLLCLLAVSGQATTYYVAANGNDNAAGNIGAPWKTLYKAATVMVANDVLYVRGGYYDYTSGSGYWFVPTANSITVSNYPGETPVFANYNQANNQSYALFGIYHLKNVRLIGLTATNCSRLCEIYYSTNCEIAYCDFGYMPNFNYLLLMQYNSQSNWIHHCKIHDGGYPDVSDPFQIGSDADTINGDYTSYNLIENNRLYHGGHSVLDLRGPYNIIRSNYCHNDPWMWEAGYKQYGGHRNIGLESGAINNVIEYNRCGYAGQPLANNGASGIEGSSSNNIVRFNTCIWNENIGIKFATKSGWPCGQNRIYNNTLAWNALSPKMQITNYTTGAILDDDKYAAYDNGYNNILKNNLFAYNSGADTWHDGNHPNTIITNRITGFAASSTKNWTNNLNGDPLFVNIAATNTTLLDGFVVLGGPFDETSLDFHLKTNSPCINAGGFLTTITSASGSGTSFTLADAGYFYNGYGMVPGDQIQLQGQTAHARITSVNYTSGQITVDTSLTWTNGQGVALAYVGSAPDIGAYEYGGSVSNINVPPIVSAPLIVWSVWQTASLKVQAQGSASGATNLFFNFGDGSGNTASANHTYTTQGTYTVTVTVTNTLGQVKTDSKSITVTQ
jgi:hypothetical protein